MKNYIGVVYLVDGEEVESFGVISKDELKELKKRCRKEYKESLKEYPNTTPEDFRIECLEDEIVHSFLGDGTITHERLDETLQEFAEMY